MIIWVNGTFGVGKTSTAGEILGLWPKTAFSAAEAAAQIAQAAEPLIERCPAVDARLTR